MGSFIDSNNIIACMMPRQERHYRKPRSYRWQRNAAHRLWSHSFHISEFAGFMGVIGVYFLETGERDTAEKVYAVLRQAAPDHLFT